MKLHDYQEYAVKFIEEHKIAALLLDMFSIQFRNPIIVSWLIQEKVSSVAVIPFSSRIYNTKRFNVCL